MCVAIEVEQGAEPLDERDRAAPRIFDAKGTGAATLPGEHLAQEHAEDPREQVAVAGDQEPDLPRQREHPLSVRDGREHAIDEVGRGAGHPATRARRAEAAGLARERDQPPGGAVVTAHAHEAVAEQAAREELLELALDEAWIAEPVLGMIAGALEDRWEMVADHAVERSVLRLATGIRARWRRRELGREHVRRCVQAGAVPLARSSNPGGLGPRRVTRRPSAGRLLIGCPYLGQSAGGRPVRTCSGATGALVSFLRRSSVR